MMNTNVQYRLSWFYVVCAWNYKPGDIVQSEDGATGYVVDIVNYDTLHVAWPTA